MENWLIASAPLIFKVIITAVVVFFLLLVLTRIFGLRTFAKMTSIDFASTIAIGSLLGIIIINGEQSILKGVIAIATILALQWLVSILVRKTRWFRKTMTNTPLLLMQGETILHKNLAKANVNTEDLMAKLREANVIKLSQVKAVVFETTGDITVLHTSSDVEVDDILLEDVKK